MIFGRAYFQRRGGGGGGGVILSEFYGNCYTVKPWSVYLRLSAIRWRKETEI